MGTWKKEKARKSKGVILLVFIEGDINEIGEKVQEVTTKSQNKVDDHYKMILIDV